MRIKATDEIPVTDHGPERRCVHEAVEMRQSEEGHATLTGYAAVFEQEAVIGGSEWGFREVIARGAFDDALGRDDVRALFNHNPDILLGRTKSGTLRLSVDQKGLRYDIDLNPDDPDAMKLRSQIIRGDVGESSFAFSIEDREQDEEWEKPKRNEMPLRRVKRAKLWDVSPVVYPAYATTSVSARSKAEELAQVRVKVEVDGRLLAEAIVPELPRAVARLAKSPEIAAREAARARLALARAQTV